MKVQVVIQLQDELFPDQFVTVAKESLPDCQSLDAAMVQLRGCKRFLTRMTAEPKPKAEGKKKAKA